MEQYKALKCRLYPTKAQEVLLAKTFGCCRMVYNHYLHKRTDYYQEHQQSLTYSKCAADMVQLKKERAFLKEVDSIALQQSLMDLNAAFQNFFEKRASYPKYKSKKHHTCSYRTVPTNNNIRMEGKYLIVPKLGSIRIKQHRQLPEGVEIKSVTISHTAGKYYASITYKYQAEVTPLPIAEDRVLGLDYKSDGLYTDSNGRACGMPRWYRLSQKKLAKQQRKLRHKTIGSHNYRKQQQHIARIHSHIANQRNDFQQKLSSVITKQYDYICVESLNMRSMANKGFGNGKATMDNAYGKFLWMLEYKLADRGGRLITVDRWFPSSQLCSHCGYRNHALKDLSIRVWDCPSCGAEDIDRDHNAAVNIRNEGLRMLQAERLLTA